MSLHFLRHPAFQYLLTILYWFCFSVSCYAENDEKPDSTKLHTIPEVTVTEKFLHSEIRSSAPLQLLQSKNFQQLNVLQISDAVKYFSGVSVKDFGGIGGLKTISVRSLGGNHTAVSYDGITLTDCQTGQIDLGRFSLENVDMISLNNGQSDNIFQPARLFASASVLNIKTLAPVFTDTKKLNGKIAIKTGSFGLLNPVGFLEGKISPKLSVNLGAEWLSADGKYPYLMQYGTNPGNSSSTEIRQNTDVQNLRVEATMYGCLSESENATLKTYFYQSERGLPGATIFYNTENASKQRIKDRTFFVQGHYEKDFSKTWAFQGFVKYNQGYLNYIDPNYPDIDGILNRSYTQNEYYGSASVLYRAFENISFSASTDGSIQSVHSDQNGFASPKRFSMLTSLAGKYVNQQLLATASLLSTIVKDVSENDLQGTDYQRISPYISLSYQPFHSQELRIRTFYKSIFRLPSFNDLYYSETGKRNLKPENSNQVDVGITFSKSINKWFNALMITADIYHNELTDKIVSYPNKNTFFWTVINYGKVNIDGFDLTTEASFQPLEKIGITAGANYTYQRALNVTNPSDRDYNNQIPYTPRVSGSGKVAVQTPWINVAYSLIWSGHRYAVNENYAENSLPAYFDHSISFSRKFHLCKKEVLTNLEVLNLLDENYQIIRWFPMPGRSFRISFSVRL